MWRHQNLRPVIAGLPMLFGESVSQLSAPLLQMNPLSRFTVECFAHLPGVLVVDTQLLCILSYRKGRIAASYKLSWRGLIWSTRRSSLRYQTTKRKCMSYIFLYRDDPSQSSDHQLFDHDPVNEGARDLHALASLAAWSPLISHVLPCCPGPYCIAERWGQSVIESYGESRGAIGTQCR